MAQPNGAPSLSSIVAGLPTVAPSRERPGGREPAPRPNGWSLRVGSLFGIDIYVHATFVLLLAWVALSHVLTGRGAAAAASGVALILAVFTIVVLHELGHALMARRFGIRTREITLLPIGGIARLERMPDKPAQELLVALAGPAVNAVLALLLFAILKTLHGPLAVHDLHVVGGPLLTKLLWINISLGVFNLLPAFPMDGGRVLRAVLSFRMDRVRATEVAARLGRGLALVLGFVGLLYNPMLVLIALFVWMGAGQEASFARMKATLEGVQIRRVMITHFETLSPQDRLSRAAELVIAGFQEDFPVVEAGHPIGLLTRANLIQGLARSGGDALVQDAMRRDFATTESSATVEGTLENADDVSNGSVLVMSERRLVGILTAGNVGEYLLIKDALKAHDVARSAWAE